MDPTRNFALGVPSFAFADLFDAHGLARLQATFLGEMQREAPALAAAYARAADEKVAPAAFSELLIDVAARLEPFLARLFGIEAEVAALRTRHQRERALTDFAGLFVAGRVRRRKPGAAGEPMAAPLRARLEAAYGRDVAESDAEGRGARGALGLLALWQRVDRRPAPSEAELAEAASELSAVLGEAVAAEQVREHVQRLLADLEAWHALRLETVDWVGYRRRRSVDPTHQALLRLEASGEATGDGGDEGPWPYEGHALRGPTSELRRRDGFALTDQRKSSREVHREVHDCMLCHPRQKDSCRDGLKDRTGAAKITPLGNALTGCPLDERISEAHVLFGRGLIVAALAMVTRDNPMCPGTGHRICNDCMKACIFQKQEPIDVPEAETHILTEVLQLPFGFELWSLLARFNPLRVEQPVPRPYQGRNALVVGLGPAGYTLAHYLLNEGFGVVALEGLKLEPLADALCGRDAWPPAAVRDAKSLYEPLDERVAGGFGGVAEYGITVRWDKNFLKLIHLHLARASTFRAFGGVRFGGTLTLDDAWAYGFDHVALAAGAGRPTLVALKNNLMRGMRAASDFLMGLQQTGAFRRQSLANLQVELPALVIGGGLTAVDTATELAAYYPVQVEKLADRVAALGEGKVMAALDDEERATLRRMLAHAHQLKAERKRGTLNLPALVRQWGGVSVAYRRSLVASPAYRLNHEEVQKALQEGIGFLENVVPLEAVPDAYGHVDGLKVRDASGREHVLPARCVIMAAGTAPNVTYAREYPQSLPLDGRGRFLQAHEVELAPKDAGAGAEQLLPAQGDLSEAFFAGAHAPAKAPGEPLRFVSFLGDNHPAYVGNVVRAMASAKRGHRHIVAPFVAADGAARKQAPVDGFTRFCAPLVDDLVGRVVKVERLTPTIVEVVVRAPAAARKFQPGQFFRLQNFERDARRIADVSLSMEGLALTGAWVDAERGLLGMVALEMGVSSRLIAQLTPGQEVVVMGPTGAATHIPQGENVLLIGGGLGNAVLFSVAAALRACGNRVLYFAAYRRPSDVYKQEEVEKASDQVVWSVESPAPSLARRPQDRVFVGNVVQALEAYAGGHLGEQAVPLRLVDRVLTIGSDRMMAAVARARQTTLAQALHPQHEAIASINSPMQCMLKEICAQCLQRHIDPVTGEETYVFSCFNQDQALATMDWSHLSARLRQNTLMEKVSGLYLDHVQAPSPAT